MVINRSSDAQDLYIAHTPSHILIALNMMHTQSNLNPSILFVLGDFAFASEICQRIASSSSADFEIFVLNGYYRLTQSQKSTHPISHLLQRCQQVMVSLTTIHHARRILKNTIVQRVYIFNDLRHEVQVLLGDLRSVGVDEFVYLDEGFAPYRENPIRSRAWIPRLIFGKSWYPLRNFGAHPLINKAYLFYPKFAHEKLKKKNITTMPPFILEHDEVDALVKAFDLGGSLQHIPRDKNKIILIFLPHSSMVSAPKRIMEWLKSIHEACVVNNAHLILKYHPREPKQDYLSSYLLTEASLVDRTIPGELLAAKFKEQSETIYAEASSVLLTFHWVCPDCKIIGVQVGTEIASKELLHILNEVGTDFQIYPYNPEDGFEFTDGNITTEK
jgi:hypothetical protein